MGHSGLQPVNLFIASSSAVLCVFLVAARVWTHWKRRKYGLEDTLVVIASILNLGLSFTTSGFGCTSVIIASYYGYHNSDIPKGAVDPITTNKWNYANSCIYNPILALVKASFLLTLIKLQCQNRLINFCLWATLVVNACFAIAAPLTCLFQCSPVPRYWDRTIPGKCVNPGAYTVSTSTIVLATDVLILIMPSWILHDLRMPLGRKIMVIAFLSFGIGVTIVGTIRTSILVKVFVIGKLEKDGNYSMEYTLSNIESGLAIIGVCGPTIKHLLGSCISALRDMDESRDRNYVYPHTSGSQGQSAARRKRKAVLGDDMLDSIYELERTWDRTEQAQEEVQLTDMNTTTVAWRVKGASSDAMSTSGQEARTPHPML